MKAILINYNHNPEWLQDYDFDYLIFDRSDDGIERNLPNVIKTKNIGNVDYDKFTYLIENYDNLPDVFLLAKSNLFKYISKDEFNLVKDSKMFTPLLTAHHSVYEPICRYADGIYEELNNSWYVPIFESKFGTYGEWASYLGLPSPEYLQFPPGGNFILTKEVIHKYPKDFYVKMRDTLGYTKLPAEAQMAERTYYSLWSKS